ncbi:hypothetical protein BSR28_08200 [Boudabousia liubingyangii]|uniref:M50 family metallopeptidase n=1 Tax=Boudabousia liubingyangii TaxID=1921764 RepID=UPI00093F411A|nr:M50 family metallopeptidase [Boudabousia liubingyangii]OKL46491.1 hypothetical protein BSR28_08200 [Boudabousia liubingyangii]
MGQTIGILVLLIGLIFSVAIHEFGHLLPAKYFGAGVPEYAVGFGPTIWKRKIGTTTYHLKAILLGGYVRILGMLRPTPVNDRIVPEAANEAESGEQTAPKNAVEEARAESAKEIQAHPDLRPFYTLSWWQKVIVMAGGPITNLVLAVIFTVLSMGAIGMLKPIPVVSEVVACDTPATACGASQAGIKPGDKILSVDGKTVSSWQNLVDQISAQPEGQELKVEVDRAGEHLSMSVPVKVKDGRSMIGIAPEIQRQRATAAEMSTMVSDQFTGTAKLIIRLPQTLWHRAGQIFGYYEQEKEVPVSVLGVVQMGAAVGGNQNPLVGPLDKLAAYLSILAALNMALFVFNLIPLLPLDGGHIVGALFEGARKAKRKLWGQNDLGAADVARLIPLSYGVMGILLLMTVILFVADIVAPVV